MTPLEWEVVSLSLKVSLWATALSLPFGILVALMLARGQFPGSSEERTSALKSKSTN